MDLRVDLFGRVNLPEIASDYELFSGDAQKLLWTCEVTGADLGVNQLLQFPD